MASTSTLYRPRHVVILAHPTGQSFNGLVANTYCEATRRLGHDAILRDLYAIGFDPLLKAEERPRDGGTALSQDVRAELDVLRATDVFVFVFPIWFGMPPAILKGYIDRVLGAGITARQVCDGEAVSLMTGKRLVCISSSGASKAWLNQQHQIEALRTLFGEYLVHAFGMSGCDALHFGETVDGLEQDYIDPLLGQVETLAARVCDALSPATTCGEALERKARRPGSACL